MFLCEPRMFSLLGVYMFYGYIKCGDCLLEWWTTVEYAPIAFLQEFLGVCNIEMSKMTKSEFRYWLSWYRDRDFCRCQIMASRKWSFRLPI